MFTTATEVVFSLGIAGFAYDLQVLEFRATEALNRPYEVKLELVSERSDLDVQLGPNEHDSWLKSLLLKAKPKDIHLVLPGSISMTFSHS